MKCCDLTAGKLRHSISFERELKVPDGSGGSTITWGEIASCRAFVRPTSGTERFNSNRIEANITHRIFIRYRTDILTSDRINFNGRLMQIRALINMEEMNRWIEIYADEGQVT